MIMFGIGMGIQRKTPHVTPKVLVGKPNIETIYRSCAGTLCECNLSVKDAVLYSYMDMCTYYSAIIYNT